MVHNNYYDTEYFCKIIKVNSKLMSLLEVSHPMFMILNGLSISSFFAFLSSSSSSSSLSSLTPLVLYFIFCLSLHLSLLPSLSPFLDRERFGHEEIGAENGKKENRTATGELFKFSAFLDVRMSLPYYLSLFCI